LDATETKGVHTMPSNKAAHTYKKNRHAAHIYNAAHRHAAHIYNATDA
jgi:hypothetical protein